MTIDIVSLLKTFWSLIFGFLNGPDTNKHKRIGAMLIITILLPLAGLFIWGLVERHMWFKNNPNSGFRNSLAPANISPATVATDTQALPASPKTK